MNGQLVIEEFTESMRPVKTVNKTAPIKRPATQNGMPFQGTVIVDGSPVDFYGSDSAWQRFKSTVGEM